MVVNVFAMIFIFQSNVWHLTASQQQVGYIEMNNDKIKPSQNSYVCIKVYINSQFGGSVKPCVGGKIRQLWNRRQNSNHVTHIIIIFI